MAPCKIHLFRITYMYSKVKKYNLLSNFYYIWHNVKKDDFITCVCYIFLVYFVYFIYKYIYLITYQFFILFINSIRIWHICLPWRALSSKASYNKSLFLLLFSTYNIFISSCEKVLSSWHCYIFFNWIILMIIGHGYLL